MMKLPMTVSAYAEAADVSKSKVREAIAKGYLKANTKVKPMQIVSGQLPLRQHEAKRLLDQALVKFPKGTYGYEGRKIHLLRGVKVVEIEVSDRLETVLKTQQQLMEMATA